MAGTFQLHRAAARAKPSWLSGVYVGGTGSVQAALDFGNVYRKRPTDYMMTFPYRGGTATNPWSGLDALADAAAMAGTAFANDKWMLCLPPFPVINGVAQGNWADAAAGAYDSHYLTWGQKLVANGHPRAKVRWAWEYNGNWSNWSTNADATGIANPSDQQANMVAAGKRVHDQMRAAGWVGPFYLSPAHGKQYDALPDPQLVANGLLGYIDGILPDGYDHDTGALGTYALRWDDWLNSHGRGMAFWRDYCSAHGLTFGFGEWGVWDLDDAQFADDVAAFIAGCLTLGLDVVEGYFNVTAVDGDHLIYPTTRFPNFANEYAIRFGPITTARSFELHRIAGRSGVAGAASFELHRNAGRTGSTPATFELHQMVSHAGAADVTSGLEVVHNGAWVPATIEQLQGNTWV